MPTCHVRNMQSMNNVELLYNISKDCQYKGLHIYLYHQYETFKGISMFS